MADEPQRKWLDAPKSSNTVRTRIIDTTAVMLLHAKTFVEPVVAGHEAMSMTDISFLIENSRHDKKAVFDLGVRKDYWNLPPKIQDRLDKIALGVRVDKDVPEILRENGFKLEEINDIIWSHSHWDHTGDPSLFPSSTTLVYGPGVSEMTPGYPKDPESGHPEANFSNRPNREISFSSSDASSLTIGGFAAYDFYGDNSFYLLETPGHSRGHMCGLARVSSDPDGSNSHFVLLGGDVCHFCGDMRPNTLHPLPLPSETDPGASDHDDERLLRKHPRFNKPPSTLRLHPRARTERRTTPWYALSTDAASGYDYPSPAVAQETVDNLTAQFDEADNVLIALAHDRSMLKVLPTLNTQPERDINSWFSEGWKEKVYWLWMHELDAEERGEEVIVDGFWKDGKKYRTFADLAQDLNR